jgi:WD40 repeat protein
MAFLGSGSSANPTQGDLKMDVEVKDPPNDSISDISWSSAADLLAVSSWNNETRIYEVDGQGQSQGKAMFKHEGPVLSVCWSVVSCTTKYTNPFNPDTNMNIGRHQSSFRRRRQGSAYA